MACPPGAASLSRFYRYPAAIWVRRYRPHSDVTEIANPMPLVPNASVARRRIQPASQPPASMRWRAFHPSLRLLRIDQDESDAAGHLAAVDPGVAGALLNEDIARFQVHLGLIKQHVDLPFQHNGIVD